MTWELGRIVCDALCSEVGICEGLCVCPSKARLEEGRE